MRAVVQRVRSATVRIGHVTAGEIGDGLLVLLGIAERDSAADVDWMVDKIVGLRVFDNDNGKLDRALTDVEGALLVVSQFTLLADTRKGRRPSFSAAAPPAVAVPLYERFIEGARSLGIRVACGEFGASMDVELVNRGPLTILLDSDDRARSRAAG